MCVYIYVWSPDDLCLEITVFPFFTWQLSLCLGRSWANQSAAEVQSAWGYGRH